MADAPTLDQLLRSIAESAPDPWRPTPFSQLNGVERDALDEPLNTLRLAGLVRLTEWQTAIGQGYVPTEAGLAALRDDRAMSRLRNGVTLAPPPALPKSRRETNAYARGEKIRVAVFDSHPTPMNRLLIALQVVMFAAGLYLALRNKGSLAEYLSNGHSPLLIQLGVSPPHLARGEWWVLLTYALVHIGGIHLAVNLLSHGALGPAVEGMFGSVRFLLIWLISAFGGGFAVAVIGGAAAGSSGAICGMIGAQAAFVGLFHQHIGRQATHQFRMWLIKSAIYIAIISSLPGVSAAGHLGGAIGGLIAGGLLGVNRFGPISLRVPALVGALALPALGVMYLTENNILRLFTTMPQVAQLEAADFKNRLQPLVDFVERRNLEVEDNIVEPLRVLRPDQRPANQVKIAIGELASLRSDQSALLDILIQTGRYKTESVEHARHAAAELLDFRAKATRLYEECLRRGDLWSLERDENSLQQLLNAGLEAEIAYHRTAGAL